MSESIEQYEIEGLTVKIMQDPDGESPREWDNLGTMVCWHRNYTLGDEHKFSDPEEFQEWAKTQKGIIMLPLYLYDHGGITMRTSAFSCPWDSGQVGYIYVTREKVLEEWSAKRISPALRKKVISNLVGEVKTYDQFLTGDVYGFQIEAPSGEHLGSCWGYFGMEDVKAEATSQAKWYAADIRKSRQEKLKFLISNHVPLERRAALLRGI